MTPQIHLPRRRGDGWLLGLVVGLAILAYATMSHGAEVPPNARATVRIKQQVCTPISCTIGSTSGTILGGLSDKRFAVLTCAHGHVDTQPASVEMLPGQWSEGQFLAIDHKSDLALLAVAYSGRLPCIPLSDQPAPVGSTVMVRGFPRGESFRERATQLLSDRGTIATVDSPFISGESGGGVSVRLPSGEALVGVIVGTDIPTVLPRDRNGYIVPFSLVSRFVLSASGGAIRSYGEGEAERRAEPDSEAQPFRRKGEPTPVPEAELGEATPVNPRPPVVESPPADAPEVATGPTDPDWSLAKLVVLVPRQEGLDKYDSIIRAVEKLSAAESGPGKIVRRWIADTTDGKASVNVVYERVSPERYRSIVDATGIRVGKYAGVVALVKHQGGGLLSPLKTLAARIGERAAASRLPDVPFELVLERTAASEFADVETALAKAEESPPGETEGEGGEGNWMLAAVYAVIRGARQAIQHYRGQA